MRRRGALVLAAALAGSTASAALDCPGPACPAIRFNSGLGDCPGPGCPAFAETMAEQQAYVSVFGALQSGSDVPQPVDGRMLLTLPDQEVLQTQMLNDANLSVPERPDLGAACTDLIKIGVARLEVIGLPPGPEDSYAAVAAQRFADWLSTDCSAQCDGPDCPQIVSRAAGAADALPEDSGLSDGTALIELRVVP